jgi:hypothetical protein
MEEEVRLFNFNSALGEMRHLEPSNRELNFIRDPERVPGLEWVRMLAREVEMARMRSHRPLPELPTERKGVGAEPEDTPSIIELLAPSGKYVGTRGSDNSIRELPGGEAAARAMFSRLCQVIEVEAEALERRVMRTLHCDGADGFVLGQDRHFGTLIEHLPHVTDGGVGDARSQLAVQGFGGGEPRRVLRDVVCDGDDPVHRRAPSGQNLTERTVRF